jgi:hypothetical protein
MVLMDRIVKIPRGKGTSSPLVKFITQRSKGDLHFGFPCKPSMVSD